MNSEVSLQFRLGWGRLIALILSTALVTAGFWTMFTGNARLGAPGRSVGWATAMWFGGMTLAVFGLLCVLIVSAIGDTASTLPGWGTQLWCVTCGFLAAYRADGTTHPWALVAAAVTVPVAGLMTVLGVRRRRRLVAAEEREATRAARLRDHGVTTSGVIVALAETGTTINDWPELRLTLRYTTEYGNEVTADGVDTFPAYDPPRRGGAVTVRYDPQAPEVMEFEVVKDSVEPPAGNGPAGDELVGDGLVGELERLAALRREGLLTDEEFRQAKLRLLTPS